MLKLNPEIKLIISIGNPTKEYEFTRHNAGHLVLDKLTAHTPGGILTGAHPFLKKGEFNIDECKVYKSDMFMNLSGDFVARKLNFLKLQPKNLLILHDDLDLKIGEYKLQFGKGPRIHNGVNSIEQTLKTKDFWRLRIGIDSRPADSQESGRDFVLNRFTKEQLEMMLGMFE